MSWKKIKTFLILLFLLINLYLIYSTSGSIMRIYSVTTVDEATISKTVDIISNNYNISIDKKLIPSKIDNLNNIDVTNYIYTDDIKNSKYEIRASGALFNVSVSTKTYSYNETNARKELVDILSHMGIAEQTYKLSFSKSDTGLVCIADEYVSGYHILNARIRAEFTPTLIALQGQWYFPHSTDVKSQDTSMRMSDVTGVLVDTAGRSAQNTQNPPKSVSKIKYGYFVSYYDENAVTKTASAIPCYMIETDNGSKYYYDASNGKFLKQED